MGMIRPAEPEGAQWELWWLYLVTVSCLTSLGVRQKRDALYFRGVKWDNVCGSPCSPVDLAPCVSPDRGRGSQGTAQLSPAGVTGVNLCSPPASSLCSLAGPPTLEEHRGLSPLAGCQATTINALAGPGRAIPLSSELWVPGPLLEHHLSPWLEMPR